MNVCRNLGAIAVVAVGIGAAFAASMGTIGYPLGLVAAVGLAIASRAIKTVRAS